MPISDYYIQAGDDTELPTKINDALDFMDGKADDAVAAVEPFADRAEAAEGVATAQAAAASGSATEALNSKNEAASIQQTVTQIAGISSIQTYTHPLARAIRLAMTSATSGSNGIRTTINTANAIGASDFTVILRATPKGYAASSGTRFTAAAASTGSSVDYPTIVFDLSGGNVTPKLAMNGTTYSATTTITSAEFLASKFWGFSVKRPTASAAGSVTFYRDENQFGTSVTIPAGTPYNFPGAAYWAICGDQNSRQPCVFYEAILLNRQYLAADVLSYSQVGIAPEDLNASQVPVYTGDFSAGRDNWDASVQFTATAGNVDGVGGVDNTLSITNSSTGTSERYARRINTLTAGKRNRLRIDVYRKAGNSSGAQALVLVGESASHILLPDVDATWKSFQIEFIATSTTLQLYLATSSGGLTTLKNTGDEFNIVATVVEQIGVIGHWNAANAQSNTGQIIDSTGNKGHGLLPAAGVNIMGANPARSRQVRSPSHSWTATNELQYATGFNQEPFPSNAAVEFIEFDSNATFNLDVGDGTTGKKFVDNFPVVVGRNRVTLTSTPFAGTTSATRKLTLKPVSATTAALTNVVATYHATEVES
ncbi:hypothetical protein [Pseudohongiella sp. O18]|uniref:hypothetical protein n=1 Tax=Pseudohongiella sp. O18 TaxID=2904248 RepID=UPI001F29374D|nr:hypothetical protein [Pseudohongiella sp. O18]